MSLSITACICTYNRYDLLGKCIQSLQAQSLDNNKYKILVMDNSPDKDVAKLEKEKYIDIENLDYKILPIPGLSNARNEGADICGTEFIAYIDDDAIASKYWLEGILDGFELYADTEMVGGPINPIWEEARPSWLPKWREGFLTIIDWGKEGPRLAENNEWFAGANMAFRTSAISKYGYFPVSLGRIGGAGSLLSNEEINIVESIKAQNGKIVYSPKATVDHLVDKTRTKREWFKKRVSWQVVSDILMNGNPWASEQCWERIENYYEKLTPELRNFNSFSLLHDEADLFHLQLEALEGFLHLSLGGFAGESRND